MLSAQHQTLNLRVYNDIVRLIASGRYPVGTRLDEQQIAEELGVSRTPLREAISKLVKDGLVVHRPYKGNYIRQFTAKEVFDLYEVRKGLELMAVRLAIPHCSPDSVFNLRVILKEIEFALETSNLESYGFADERFHEAIAQLSGNQTLISMLARLSGQIQLVRNMANQDPSVVEITAMERPGIVEAMAEGDTTKAMHLMEEHIELVQRSMIRRIEAAQGILSIETILAFPK